jgi:ABC-type Fe3+/spermidine/putrescine transport system ATPase subunit
MQTELKDIQSRLNMTTVYVTHDQEEALTMSDRIAIMKNGKIMQVGAPREVYEKPSCSFVATFLGEANLIQGVVESSNDRKNAVRTASGEVLRCWGESPVGSKVSLFVRPEKIDLLDVSGASPSPGRSAVKATVKHVRFQGSTVHYTLASEGGLEISAELRNAPSNSHFSPGLEVLASWDPDVSSALSE